MTLRDLIDKQGIRDQLYAASASGFIIPIKFDQELSIESLSHIVKSRLPGNAFRVGDPIFAEVGSASVLINDGFGDVTIERVVCPNNRWRDYIRDTEHWDTDNSTATVDTTNYKIQF